MATLAIKIDPTGAQAGARVVKRELADINRSATEVERGIGRTGRTSTESFNAMARGSRVAETAFTSLRSVMVGGASVMGAAIAASLSVKPLFAFKDALAEVSTLVDTATFDMKALERAAIGQSKAFGGSAAAQTKAYYQIISAGASSVAEATDILTASNKLAIGGVTDVATAADGLTSVLNAYGDKVEGAASVSDALFIAMRAGKTTIGELSGALGKVAPLAAQTGVSFDELVASISALTKGGIGTAEATTGIRAVLAAIAKPTSEASKLAAQLGLDFSASALKSKGFEEFLDELVKKTGGSTDALAQLFGGVEALVPVLALSGAAGKDFTAILEQMGEKAGSTQEAVDSMMESPGFQAGRIWSNLQAEILGTSTAFSDGLVSAMKATADNMGGLVTAVTIFTAGHLATAVLSASVSMLALTQSIGVATIAARGLSLALAFVGGPIGAAVMALAGTYYYLSTRTDETAAAARGLSDANHTLVERIKATNVASGEAVTNTTNAAEASLKATQATLARAKAELSLSEALNAQDVRSRSYAEGGRAVSFDQLSAERRAAILDAANQNDPASASRRAIAADLEKQLSDTQNHMNALSIMATYASDSIDKVSDSSNAASLALAGLGKSSDIFSNFGKSGTFEAQTQGLREYIDKAEQAASATGAIEDAQKQLATFAEVALGKVAGLTDTTAKGYGSISDALKKLAQDASTASISEDMVVSRLKDIADGLRDMGVGESAIQRITGAFATLTGQINGATAALSQYQNQQTYTFANGSSVNVTRGTTGGIGGLSNNALPGSIDPNTGVWHRPGFAEGGFTGVGGRGEPAGVVHKGEFVFTKAQTSALGVQTLQAIAQGAANGYADGGPVGISGGVSSVMGSMSVSQIEINTAETVDLLKRQIGYLDTIESDLVTMTKELRTLGSSSSGSFSSGSSGSSSSGSTGKFASTSGGIGSSTKKTQKEIAEGLGMNYIPGLQYYENGAVFGQDAWRATAGTGTGWYDPTNAGSHWSSAGNFNSTNMGTTIVSKFASGGMIHPGGSGPASGDQQKVQLFKNPDEAVFVLTGQQRAAIRDATQAANSNKSANAQANITLNITMPVMDTVNPSSRRAVMDELGAKVRQATSRTNG